MTEIPVVRIGDGTGIPILGFGTWQLHGRQAYDAIRWALDAGYRHIDTATMYKNEAEVGRAIRDSGLDRGDLFLTTKLPPGNAGRERNTIEDSLRALGTQYVDLWLVHWPPRRKGDSERIWRAFTGIRDDGLAHFIGVSNYSTAQVDELAAATGQTPAVNQVPWSVGGGHDARLLSEFRERGVVVEGYSPLKDTRLSNPVLVQIADAHAVTPAQVVLRWHVQLGIVVIPRSSKRERIVANADLFGFALTDQEMERLSSL
ncbi:MAG TPA: aldo/keto reductase [Streptosporangiaceae bacterium]|jgi:diketogulonate reductase-like aldo/keto reductase